MAHLEGILQCGSLFPTTVLSVFRAADVDKDGVVSGNEAVAFFQSTGVDKSYLKSVWDLATDSQPGGLTPVHFSRALRLISLLQTGCQLTDGFVSKALHPQTGLQLPDPKFGDRYLEQVCIMLVHVCMIIGLYAHTHHMHLVSVHPVVIPHV